MSPSLNRFTRALEWLREALGLQGEQLPRDLDVSKALAQLDVGQGGWAFASWRAGAAAGATGAVVSIASANPGLQYIVVSLDVSQLAAGTYTLEIRDAAGVAIVTPVVTTATGDWDALYSGRPLYVPPNHQLVANKSGVGAWTSRYVIGAFPAGFNPLW